jgi:UDP-3-O-[3-hydroxymyristoyl] glucosamine N-acyltransferase
MKAIEIAMIVKGILDGNPDDEIISVAKIEFAEKNQISFISNPLYEKFYYTTKAGALLVSNDFTVKDKRSDVNLIKVKDPYLAFLNVIELFEENDDLAFSGISDNSVIGNNCDISEDVYISDFVKIGQGCKIGSGTKIHANSTIEPFVEIGSDCIIYPNVVIYKGCKFGNNVIIHSHTVIGSDGFGQLRHDDGSFQKIPQKGIVVIEDDVEIGSNCSIDRATIGETRICKGVKLDNQIQIGHNVIIGENTVIVAQVGVAGSTKIGKRCMIGGQSGIVGHLEICDDVIIGASVGVSKSITKPGLYTGYRAKPSKENLKQEIYIKKIPELEEKIKILQKKLDKKENKLIK